MLSPKESDVYDDRILSLYRTAFPPDEQISPAKLHRLLGHGGRLLLFEDQEEFIGFCLTFGYDGVLYVAYLAVVPGKRNLGYGSDILEYVLSENRYRACFLTAEEGVGTGKALEDRRRRIRFYQRNGWRKTGTVFITLGVNLEVYAADSAPTHEDAITLLKRFYDVQDGIIEGRGRRSATGRIPLSRTGNAVFLRASLL